MKKIILSLASLISIARSTHATELYLNKINNQTAHKIAWEKLPLPGMLGKMRPIIIDRFDGIQPNMPIIPPATLSFTNPNKPSQKVFLELTLDRKVLKRRPRPGEDPNKYQYLELSATTKSADGKVLRTERERLDDNVSYDLNVTIKGLNLQKTEVRIEARKSNTP